MSDRFETPMHEALALARAAIGLTEPNPRVGCVIVAPDGRVLGRPPLHPLVQRVVLAR
jgi:diaminohydroxyphosphoribosylaminopyrimidine deaminase/5-amino-6-(5-phosphoribosylamino)uracil reductase